MQRVISKGIILYALRLKTRFYGDVAEVDVTIFLLYQNKRLTVLLAAEKSSFGSI